MKNRILGDLAKNKAVSEEYGVSLEEMRRYMDKRGIGGMIDPLIEFALRAARIIDNMLSFSRKSDYTFAEHDPYALRDKILEVLINDYDLKKKYDFHQIEILKSLPQKRRVKAPALACRSHIISLLKTMAAP